MELRVADVRGLHPDCILSVRAGQARRQAPLGQLATRPLRFPEQTGAGASGHLKIDLLQPLASECLVLHPAASSYTIGVDSAGGKPSSFRLMLNQFGPKAAAPPAADKSGAAENEAVVSVQQYLEKFRVLEYMQRLLQALVEAKPEDPFEFLWRQLGSMLGGEQRAEPGPKLGARPTEPEPATPSAERLVPGEARSSRAGGQPPARREHGDEALADVVRKQLQRPLPDGAPARYGAPRPDGALAGDGAPEPDGVLAGHGALAGDAGQGGQSPFRCEHRERRAPEPDGRLPVRFERRVSQERLAHLKGECRQHLEEAVRCGTIGSLGAKLSECDGGQHFTGSVMPQFGSAPDGAGAASPPAPEPAQGASARGPVPTAGSASAVVGLHHEAASAPLTGPATAEATSALLTEPTAAEVGRSSGAAAHAAGAAHKMIPRQRTLLPTGWAGAAPT